MEFKNKDFRFQRYLNMSFSFIPKYWGNYLHFFCLNFLPGLVCELGNAYKVVSNYD